VRLVQPEHQINDLAPEDVRTGTAAVGQHIAVVAPDVWQRRVLLLARLGDILNGGPEQETSLTRGQLWRVK